MQTVSIEKFTQAIFSAGKKSETTYIHEAFVNDISGNGQLHLESSISQSGDFTVWWLNRIGFEWAETDISYLNKYVKYFSSIGYFEFEE